MPEFDKTEINGDDENPEEPKESTEAERNRIQRESREATGSGHGNRWKRSEVSGASYPPPQNARVTFELVRAGDLVVDPRYNRDIKQPWVQEIADHFNPDQLQALNISRRLYRFVQRSQARMIEEQVFDGNLKASNRVEYVIISGQHRLLATLLAKGPDFLLPCVVYDRLTEKQEAELFALFDEKVRPHQAYQRHRSYVFGGNEEALEIERIVTNTGLSVYKGTTSGNRDGVIYAVSTLYAIRRNMGADILQRALEIHYSAWTGNPDGYTAPMLQGTTLMIKRFGVYYAWRDEYLAIALGDPAHNPTSIRQRAQGAATGVSATSISQEVGRLEHRYYNQGKKGYARLPEWNATAKEILLASDAAKTARERRGRGAGSGGAGGADGDD